MVAEGSATPHGNYEMPGEWNKLSNEALRAWLLLLERKLQRARERVSRAEEELDAIVCELVELQLKLAGSIAGQSGQSLAPEVRSLPRKPRRQADASFVGVNSVTLIAQADGSAMAQVEGRLHIPLPPLLAAMLDVLRADSDVSADHMVGWKSIAAIQAGLKERTKRQYSKAAIKELVYRLRQLLEKHGENFSLVQNNRRLGYRLAVRRGLGGRPEGDNL